MMLTPKDVGNGESLLFCRDDCGRSVVPFSGSLPDTVPLASRRQADTC